MISSSSEVSWKASGSERCSSYLQYYQSLNIHVHVSTDASTHTQLYGISRSFVAATNMITMDVALIYLILYMYM
jgi:hypothetical protein